MSAGKEGAPVLHHVPATGSSFLVVPCSEDHGTPLLFSTSLWSAHLPGSVLYKVCLVFGASFSTVRLEGLATQDFGNEHIPSTRSHPLLLPAYHQIYHQRSSSMKKTIPLTLPAFAGLVHASSDCKQG